MTKYQANAESCLKAASRFAAQANSHRIPLCDRVHCARMARALAAAARRYAELDQDAREQGDCA